MEHFPPPTVLSWSAWAVRHCWEIAMSQRLHVLSHCREVPERRGGCPDSPGGVNVPGRSV